MCVFHSYYTALKRCSHERTTVFLERQNRGERERERKREIVSELELYSLCWRFGFFSLVVQEHECLLALLRVVFSRWSRRKKERECAEEKENDFKNKRDDTEHRL